MVWDLRGALLKKEERETARLANFDFMLRARTFKLLAQKLGPGAENDAIGKLIARTDDEGALAELVRRFPGTAMDLGTLYEQSRIQARKQLVEEFGDPSPYRLA